MTSRISVVICVCRALFKARDRSVISSCALSVAAVMAVMRDASSDAADSSIIRYNAASMLRGSSVASNSSAGGS